MLTEPNTLRARLLGAEPANVNRRRRLEKEIDDMFTDRLSHRGRMYWVFSLAAGVALTLFGVSVLARAAPDGFVRAVWWIYTIANAGFVLFAAHVVRTGRLDTGKLLLVAKASPVLTLVITLILFARAMVDPTTEAVLWVLFGIIFLVVAVAGIVYGRVVAAEWRQREQALRMELRLEELIERLGPPDDGLGVTADIR